MRLVLGQALRWSRLAPSGALRALALSLAGSQGSLEPLAGVEAGTTSMKSEHPVAWEGLRLRRCDRRGVWLVPGGSHGAIGLVGGHVDDAEFCAVGADLAVDEDLGAQGERGRQS